MVFLFSNNARFREDLSSCIITWLSMRMQITNIVTLVIRPSKGYWWQVTVLKKTGDNLVLMNQQPTKTDRKGVTFCDSNNPFLISMKRHFFHFDWDIVTRTVWRFRDLSSLNIVFVIGRKRGEITRNRSAFWRRLKKVKTSHCRKDKKNNLGNNCR